MKNLILSSAHSTHPQIDLQIESGEYFLKKEERELRKTEKKKVSGRQLWCRGGGSRTAQQETLADDDEQILALAEGAIAVAPNMLRIYFLRPMCSRTTFDSMHPLCFRGPSPIFITSHMLLLSPSSLQETSEVKSKERQAKREQAFVPPVEQAPRTKGAAGKGTAAPLDVAALKKSLKRESKATGVQNAKDYVLPSKKVKRDKKKAGGEA